MNYDISEYKISDDNFLRFVLGNPKQKPLFFIGINPSVANDQKPDNTIRKVMTFCENYGYDSFVMLNIYPQRATNPNNLDENINKNSHEQNLIFIEEIFKKYEKISIVGAWGNLISKRKFFKNCLEDIYGISKKYEVSWFSLGNLTKQNNPRHPLYVSYKENLTVFDIENYLKNF